MFLQIQDFPLSVLGNSIYAKTRSSAILVACDEEVATQIAILLNKTQEISITVPPFIRVPSS